MIYRNQDNFNNSLNRIHISEQRDVVASYCATRSSGEKALKI